MGHGGATISLFVLCADRCGGADHYTCLCCWKIVACSQRDMAYATILVRFVYLSPGRLIKKVGRDAMDGDFVLIIVVIRRASGLD